MAFVSNSNNIFVGNATGSGTVNNSFGATSSTGTQNLATSVNFLMNPSLAGAAALYGKDIPPFRNELNQFASYSPVFTLGCLTNIELNFPLSYRILGPAVKIIRSGGRGGPTIPSIYDIGGKTEFFIEDVEIKNHVAPNPGTRHSNATSVRFKVIEPYSMGQFFHNLRTASLVCGHPNYIDAPFLLSVAFIGYDDDGDVKSSFFSQRHFPIRIIQADMSVSEAGAVYDCVGVPYNEIAASNRSASVKRDIQAKGKTVAEVLETGLQSVSGEYNKHAMDVEKAQQGKQDKIVIMFPNTGGLSGVTSFVSNVFNSAKSALGGLQGQFESLIGNQPNANPKGGAQYLGKNVQVVTTGSMMGDRFKAEAKGNLNEIGSSPINRPGGSANGGDTAYTIPGAAESITDPGNIDPGKMANDPNIFSFNFAAGTSVLDIIEEVILSSDYARKMMKDSPDAQGRLNWFRIETQTYNDGGLLGGLFSGNSPKVYVYRVVKYRVDESTVANPGASLSSTLIKQAFAAKAYSYIYTGQNDDIIDFDLKFDMAFFTGIPAARSQQNLLKKLGGQLAGFQTDKDETPSGGSGSGDTGGSSAPTKDDASDIDTVNGGGGPETAGNNAARYFNNMIINTGNDMLKVDLKIHGDPYFLCDSGLGNYVGLPSLGFFPINLDGTMNPIDGEVHIVLNFRTPVDYDEDDGYVKYPLGGFLPIAMFSGVYQVITVENNFDKGQFSQTLSLVRKRNQDLSLESVAGKVISFLTGGGKKAINSGNIMNEIQGGTTDQQGF